MYPQDLGTQGGELRAQHGHIQLQQMPLMVPPVSNTFNPMTNGSVPQETKRPCWPAHPAATTWTELPPKPALPHTTSRWTPALSPFRGDHTQSSQALPSQGRYNLRSMSQRSFATTPGNNDGRVDDGAEAATVHHRTAYSGKEQLSSPAFDFEMAIPRHTLALPKEKVKSPPSKKSGGVPEPTKSYLEAASAQPARMIPRSKALLVIFDLNGTLLHRKVGSAKYTERPYTQTFINYCIDKFTVMVWSSATRSNVDAMCDKLFADHPGIPRWTRDDFGLTKDDMKRNVQVYKRLTRVWSTESIQDKHPYRARGAKWNQSNTVLIDDSKEKARSEPFNCITLPTFDGYPEGGASVLPLVHDYLNVLACQEDVSRYIKQHPFNVNKEPPKIPSTALMSDGEYAKVDIDACIEAIGEVCAEGAAMARRGRSDIIQAS